MDTNNRIGVNNADLETILERIQNLPTAGDDPGSEEEITLQEKVVSPTTSVQEVIPDSGYDGLSKVTVDRVRLQSKSVVPNTTTQTIVPEDSYHGLSEVTVNAVTKNIDENITPGNIREGIDILGVTGTLKQGITPTGTVNITTNGTHNVTNYASANVNVPPEDLSTPLVNQGNIITNQESKISNIISALAGKAAGGGSEQYSTIVNSIIERTLTGAYVNNEITKIGGNSLRSLPISSLHCENVTRVEGEAIRQCSNLETVYLPKCTSLASYSLGICSKLKRVELGAATSIAGYSFYQCSALTTLIIRNTSSVCSLANVNAFTSSGVANGTGYVYVPDNLVDSYKAASNWSTYAAQIKPLSEL